MNYLPVIVAGVAAFAFGWLWHGPLFGKVWMQLMGITMPETMTPEMKKKMVRSIVLGLIGQIVSAAVLVCIVNQIGTSGVINILGIAVSLWLGFVVTTLANGPLWENKSVKLFLFNCAYHLGAVIIMAVVVALMI